MPRFESYGFRYNAGDYADIGIIMSLDGGSNNQYHFGMSIKLEGAVNSLAAGCSALAAGITLLLF